MELEGSLLYWQDDTTGPYPERNESSSHLPCVSMIHSNILSSVPSSSKWSFPFRFSNILLETIYNTVNI